MTGLVFSRLTVLCEVKRDGKSRSRYWSCVCQCGVKTVVNGSSLRSGLIKSCGCYRSEIAKKVGDRTRTHGMTKTSIYAIWDSMIQRCTNPNRKDYFKYGGRGIVVCNEWMTFENFISDMGERPIGLSLDRIDNNGNYDKANCRWATATQQGRNQSTNRLITFNNVTRCISEWAEVLQMNKNSLEARFRRGWSVDKAFMEPIQKKAIYA